MYSDKTYFLAKIKESELKKLTDVTEAGQINEDNLNSAIEAADSLINIYCPELEDVSPADIPKAVRQWSYDIAVYYLHDRIQYIDIPERVKDKYDAAVNSLKDIASGKAHLPLPETDENSEGGGVDFAVNENVFNRSAV